MDALVFDADGMTSSSFDYEVVADRLAPIFDEGGERSPYRFFTALAAASLYTTADDLVALLTAIGRPREEGGLLSTEKLAEKATAEARIATLPIWGPGRTIYVSEAGSGEGIGHDGRNFPAINTAARLHRECADGIVVLATGTHTIASELADTWVRWRTGRMSLTARDRVLKSGIVACASASRAPSYRNEGPRGALGLQGRKSF
jgi:hypothetical protein